MKARLEQANDRIKQLEENNKSIGARATEALEKQKKSFMNAFTEQISKNKALQDEITSLKDSHQKELSMISEKIKATIARKDSVIQQLMEKLK